MDNIYHVLPEGDLREHSNDSDKLCWCKPDIEDYGYGTLIAHNSMDGREKFENGERKPS